MNSENVNDQDSLHCPDEEEKEEDLISFEDYEDVDDWENSFRFTSGFLFYGEIQHICSGLGEYPRVLSTDVTFKIVFGYKLKLLTVFFFDMHIRRRVLFLAVIRSERSFFSDLF